jgi:hypothetical protein
MQDRLAEDKVSKADTTERDLAPPDQRVDAALRHTEKLCHRVDAHVLARRHGVQPL